MQRIIAGGTGLIGTALVNHWLKQQHEITVIGRNKDIIKNTFQDRVRALTWDELAPEMFANTEVVVNLAGANIAKQKWSPARKQEIVSSRVDSTTRLAWLVAMQEKHKPMLFNASAIGVYGLQPNTQSLPPAFTEKTPIDFNIAPDFLAYVGREWEKPTQIASDRGVRVVNLRFGVVLTKSGGALPQIALPYTFFMGGPIGSGRQAMSWVALNDVLLAIDYLIPKTEITGPVNIVAPECVQQHQFAKTLGSVLHRPSLMPMPSFFISTLLGEMGKELLLSGQHVYPERLLNEGFTFTYPMLAQCLQAIYQ